MGNESIVEGVWGKYTFRKIRPQDVDKVIEHIKTFFLRDEPTSALLGYSEQYCKEFEVLARALIEHGLSFWAEDNDTGDVAAVRVTYRHRRDTTFDGVEINCRTFKELYRLVDLCHKGLDIFEHYNLDEYADFFVASCAPKYRKQGITSELYRRSLKFLAAEGFKLAKSVFTSPWTRMAASNLGFEEVYRLDYADMKDDDGNPVFEKETLNEEHYASMMCKRI